MSPIPLKWYTPGAFATILGYEASFGAPYGHHNVYFRGGEGALRYHDEENPEEIWQRAERESLAGELLTIPHHTGGFARPGGGVKHDWSIHDSRFRTTIEIYSSHGLSEEYAPDHPISMDVSDFTFNGPGDPGNYTVDAWLAGLKLGTIGSSDNHGAQPGKEGFGTMAVWAPELAREAVFDAIRNRRTYGTTGSRIYLEFTVNGEPMGGETVLDRRRSAGGSARGGAGHRPPALDSRPARRPRPARSRVSVSSTKRGFPAAARRSISTSIGPTRHHPLALSTTSACASATSSTAAWRRRGAVRCG